MVVSRFVLQLLQFQNCGVRNRGRRARERELRSAEARKAKLRAKLWTTSMAAKAVFISPSQSPRGAGSCRGRADAGRAGARVEQERVFATCLVAVLHSLDSSFRPSKSLQDAKYLPSTSHWIQPNSNEHVPSLPSSSSSPPSLPTTLPSMFSDEIATLRRLGVRHVRSLLRPLAERTLISFVFGRSSCRRSTLRPSSRPR